MEQVPNWGPAQHSIFDQISPQSVRIKRLGHGPGRATNKDRFLVVVSAAHSAYYSMGAKDFLVESKGAEVQNEKSYTASFSYSFMRAR